MVLIVSLVSTDMFFSTAFSADTKDSSNRPVITVGGKQITFNPTLGYPSNLGSLIHLVLILAVQSSSPVNQNKQINVTKRRGRGRDRPPG